jgi:hypothetical protein
MFVPQDAAKRRQLAGFENTGTARDWMIEGAIREDDYVDNPALGTLGCRRPENPPSQVNRVLHHFLDVQRGGRGLTVFGQELGFPAPDWALGRQGRGPGPDQSQFSLPDARDYQYQSLTAPSRELRDQHTARLFRALGHVVHVLEDMAQPQHTRNDPHAGCVDLVAGEHSWYEHYIETRTMGRRFLRRGQVSPPLVFGGYGTVDIRPYQEFFADADQRGLADFSSQNFLSAGTNLSVIFGNCGGLPQPPCEASAYGTETRPFSIQTRAGAVISGTVTLYTRDVVDALTGEVIPKVPLSSSSVWDQHLEAKELLPLFSLNSINYDAMADILVPRAVGYAAGFLNAFFRGSLSATYEAQSLRISGSAETMDGDFQLLYEKSDGTRGALATWTALRVDPDQPSPPLSTPPLPPDATPGEPCWLIFRGQLGLEPGAVVGSQAPCPPAPPPPLGNWYVYSCVLKKYGSTQEVRYNYATTSPPLDSDGLPASIFFLGWPTGQTACGIVARGLAAQPPGTTTEHLT